MDRSVRAGASSPSARRVGRALRGGYVSIMLCLLLVAILFAGTMRAVAWNAAGALAVLALVLGPAVGGVDRLRAWRLLALAGLLLLASNYTVLGDEVRGYVTLPTAIDFLACGAYPLAAVAVLVIAMRGS